MDVRFSDKVVVTGAPANDAVDTVDARLIEELYRAHAHKVRRRAISLVKCREAAQDVTQEVFLRAFGARANLATVEAQLRWLFRITTNISLNWLRDGTRRNRILVRITSPDEATTRPQVDSALTVRALMEEMPLALQELAISYFVDEMSQDELSARLAVPRRTIGYRLTRFRAMALARESGARS